MLCKSALTVQIALNRYGLDALLPLIEEIHQEGIGTERREIPIGAEQNGVRNTGRAGQRGVTWLDLE